MEAHVLLVFDIDTKAVTNYAIETAKNRSPISVIKITEDQVRDIVVEVLRSEVSHTVEEHFKGGGDAINLILASGDLNESLRYLVRKNTEKRIALLGGLLEDM